MLKIGTIGTGNIVSEFIEACREVSGVEVSCLYSRSLEKAKIFALKNNLSVRIVDNFEDMLDHIDIIYIASPNGLHYQQAKYFLQQQKHVLIEKPATFLAQELIELREVAIINNVFLMEAFKPLHLPAYQVLQENVNRIHPFLATFHCNQYSSRMKEVLLDDYNSVFDETLGKGSLYDMLIYPVELAVALFGPVKDVKAMSHKLKNGVDINNVVLLRHHNNILTNIVCSKAAVGISDSEILSYDATINFTNLTKLETIMIYNRLTNKTMMLPLAAEHQNKMYYELQHFVNIINTGNYPEMQRLLDYSIAAIRILEAVQVNEEQQGELLNEIK
ncbi:oxidoreductase [Spiroplasma sp. NBRC 100390]|uniref:Gfo/Idh/MocA family protein n=1 Tax=unclassified Spiroplasma TaxID=2637901 RepID=UPI000892972B|nr:MULTISPECIES: Gfo/Idh/MocA family oxidoreductase [unclassified Spiroplasma]AOX44148.1 oxidoreductase [Spiroplasma sp. TU-14]APE13618.1 oxidoreductase [Spiroplasma sp. NBRC 100390]